MYMCVTEHSAVLTRAVIINKLSYDASDAISCLNTYF